MTPLIQATYGDLASWPWLTRIGKDINKIPAKSYTATQAPTGELVVVNTSDQAGGGGLVTCAVPVPALGVPLPYTELSLEAFLTDIPWRFESDVKQCNIGAHSGGQINIANISNFSTQWKQMNGPLGQWQIDGNPPGWLGTYWTPTLTTGAWFKFRIRGYTDLAAKTYSVLSGRFGKQRFDVPAALQNVPWEVSNWGPTPVAMVQLQTEIALPGVLTVRYRKIRVKFRNLPF